MPFTQRTLQTVPRVSYKKSSSTPLVLIYTILLGTCVFLTPGDKQLVPPSLCVNFISPKNNTTSQSPPQLEKLTLVCTYFKGSGRDNTHVHIATYFSSSCLVASTHAVLTVIPIYVYQHSMYPGHAKEMSTSLRSWDHAFYM